MIISDKQELRRCVKQLVRRMEICEGDLSFDFAGGELGVQPMLLHWAHPSASPGETFRRAVADQTPFHEDAVAMFAALDAMDLPVRDLERAEAMRAQYERPAYLREILDTARAKCVLVRVPMEQPVRFEDDRCEPLLCVGAFVPGRYGVDYAAQAQQIAQSASACGARNLLMTAYDPQALRYCVLPACQDEGLALHIRLETRGQVEEFARLLDEFEGVRALASSPQENALIDAAAERVRLLVRLESPAGIGYALSRLGTRFVAFSACADQPELMLGRWIMAREAIWQALAQAYLPLARTGFELQSSMIERDVRRLLCDNLLALCRPEGWRSTAGKAI
ncbi:MAG: hypothetical protein ACI4PG_00245 [Candidatus Ventricola sp.]